MLLQIDTLMIKAGGETNNSQADLAALRGARFVMTSEIEEGQRLSEGKLKRISAIWNRLHAIPMTVVIQNKDQELGLFHAYQHWAEECGERSTTEQSFGIEKHSANAGAEYRGSGSSMRHKESPPQKNK